MTSVPASRQASAPALSAKQRAQLRAELAAELRRLLPGAAPVDEQLLRDLAPRARRQALQIIDALRRMETKTFGVCVGCLSPISYERLSAIPETTVCADCSWTRELALQG
jgi:RNA polymerase-binding transcription factor DksA